MIIRTSIQTLPSMREAYDRLLAMTADYTKTNRGKPSIELTLTSQSSPVRDKGGRMVVDDRGRIKLGPELIEIRAVYDDAAPDQMTEYRWFAARAARP
jgi:hypothetical protein